MQLSLNKNSLIHQSSLYLMVSIEYDPVEERYDRSDFPVFSVRHLATTKTVSSEDGFSDFSARAPTLVHNNQQLFQSKYLIESMNYDQSIYTSDFHFKIMHSFSHNGFIYFLYTITNKILPESCNRIDTMDSMSNQTSTKIVTRLLRICDTKSSNANGHSGEKPQHQQQQQQQQSSNQDTMEQQFNSIFNAGSSGASLATLTETVLDCDDQIDGKFHLLQSAHFHENPSKPESSTLFLTFSSTKSAASSAVCRITIKEIDNHFLLMLRKCLDGDNDYGELVSPYSNKNSWKTPCRCSTMTDQNKKPTVYTAQDHAKLFCHNDMFNYMNSRQTLTLKAIQMDTFEPSRPVTAITSMPISNDMGLSDEQNLVLILTDLSAQLLLMSYNADSNLARQYDQISLLSPPSEALAPGWNNQSEIAYSVQAASTISLSVADYGNLKKKLY